MPNDPDDANETIFEAAGGIAPPLDRVQFAPRLMDEVERVEMGDWGQRMACRRLVG